MRGTITFQLAPGELAAFRMRGTSTFQLAPGELGRGEHRKVFQGHGSSLPVGRGAFYLWAEGH
ncbi:unnamed protein product [Camellia sinensis]